LPLYESKTGKTREIELSQELHERIWQAYGFGDSDSYAFNSVRNARKPYSRMTYHRKLKQAAEALNISVSAHSARKLYARRVFNLTGDIFSVQEALRHKYVTTTATYLDIDLNALITAAAKK
jgi:integrase